MKEVTRTTVKTAPENAQNTEVLDEGTREVLDEYSRKFLIFIQQEKDRARKSAQEESERIIAEAHNKSRLIYDKAVRDAAAQLESITSRSKHTYKLVADEIDRLLKAVSAVQEKTEQEIAGIKASLSQEAEAVAETFKKEAEKIAATGQRLRSEFEASARAIAELKQRLEGDIGPAPEDGAAPREPAAPDLKNKVVREDSAIRSAPSMEEAPTKRQTDKMFVGTLNLEVNRATSGTAKRFKEALSKIPGVEISLAEEPAKDKSRIVVFVSRPLPLLSILHQMSLVKSAVGDEDGIRISLQSGDGWIG